MIIAALLAGGTWLLIGQAASWPRLLSALRRVDPWWAAAAFGGVVAGYVGYALMYQAIAAVDHGPRPGLRLTVRLTIAVFGFSILATAAGRLGSEYWTLRRMRERPAQAWARVLALNTAEWAVLAALAWWGALALLAGSGGDAPLAVELAWLCLPPACVAAGLYLTSARRRRLAEDRGGRVRRTFASALRAIVLLHCLRRQRGSLARCLAGGLLHWGGDLLMVWAALRAFGVHLGYPQLAVGFATGYAATIVPLPAGGAGGMEAAGTYALTLVGVPLGPALLATLVQRAFTYWLPLAVAVVSAGWLRRLGRDLTGVRRQPLRGPHLASPVVAGDPC